MSEKFGLVTLKLGMLETNCYIVSDPLTSEALIIDPGGEADRIIRTINEKKLLPVAIVNTHGHADHISANEALRKYFKIPLCIHKDDAPFLKDTRLNGSSMLPGHLTAPAEADVLLENGSELKAGSLVFKVIHTPGHTPGGICLYLDGVLFTGDTLFRGDIGRSDLAGGDEDALMRSLRVFKDYPPATIIYPGHGPASVLRKEFSENPYLA